MRISVGFFALLAATLLLFVAEAQAKRFGGGSSLGKQYSTFSRSVPPARQATPSTAQPRAAQTNPRGVGASRWLGPLAGLAAGGLLASLFFGDAFEGLQIMDILVFGALIFGGMVLLRSFRRQASAQTAGGSALGAAAESLGDPGRSGVVSGPQAQGNVVGDDAPTWFQPESFVAGAKAHFLHLQAAWDRGDFREIEEYTTPELFSALQREHGRLGRETHETEVMMLTAELVGVRREADRVVASVHFTGMLREQPAGESGALSEVWHVDHDWASPKGDWRIAGIQQTEA
jgi:predicted lipid-binding transport protein (Tim44 family)